MREVVVVSAVRTAIGTFGGSLKDLPPIQLGAMVVKEALARADDERRATEEHYRPYLIDASDALIEYAGKRAR